MYRKKKSLFEDLLRFQGIARDLVYWAGCRRSCCILGEMKNGTVWVSKNFELHRERSKIIGGCWRGIENVTDKKRVFLIVL